MSAVEFRPKPDREPPPVERIGLLRWLRHHLFSSWPDAILSLALIAGLVAVVPQLIRWALIDSVWYATDPSVCRGSTGACWAVIAEKHRVMLFGLYPYEEHWRALCALIVYVSVLVISGIPRFWRWRVLLPLWLAGAALVVGLMLGGGLGLRWVGTSEWGGLPLTMVVFTGQVLIGMPLALLLALGRRSRLPVLRTLCVLVIEGARAVPPVMTLFFAAVVFPLFLPPGLDIDKLARIVIAMGIYFGCLQAEVIRGGLQAIPHGQFEAADSVGLRFWPRTLLVILPQALRIVIPGLVNHIIQAFKNSTLVIIVGLFDILNATSAAVADPNWVLYFTEAYLFVALVYFCGAFALAKYGQFLERLFRPATGESG